MILLHLFSRFIPFHGGPQNCVGDQFTFLEVIAALAVVLQKMDMQLVPDQKINMTTGATIHTTSVRKHAMHIFYNTLVLFIIQLISIGVK